MGPQRMRDRIRLSGGFIVHIVAKEIGVKSTDDPKIALQSATILARAPEFQIWSNR